MNTNQKDDELQSWELHRLLVEAVSSHLSKDEEHVYLPSMDPTISSRHNLVIWEGYPCKDMFTTLELEVKLGRKYAIITVVSDYPEFRQQSRSDANLVRMTFKHIKEIFKGENL